MTTDLLPDGELAMIAWRTQRAGVLRQEAYLVRSRAEREIKRIRSEAVAEGRRLRAEAKAIESGQVFYQGERNES